MKNLGLKVATIICGGLAVINGLLAVLGLICLIPDMCLFFTIPTLLFGFPTIKLAKKLGWIKPKEKANKVKEETKVESEQLMFDLKEEPVKEEKPVDNVIQFKQKENKQEKEELIKEKRTMYQRACDKVDEWTEKLEKSNEESRQRRMEIENNKTEEEKAKEAESQRKWNKAGEIIGTVLGALLAIGVIVGGIALVCFVGYYILVFLFNAALYIIGFGLFLVIAGWFISFWWSLVRHEHIDKPRGIIRVRVKHRRRW